MSDRRTEEGRPAVLLSDGQERELRVEVDELLDDYFLYIATGAFHRFLESLLQFGVVVHITLAVTG